MDLQHLNDEVKEEEEIYPLKDFDWSNKLPVIPKDEEGFVQSFLPSEIKEFKDFFDEFGFVVIRDVLSKVEVEASIQEIWDQIENSKVTPSVVASITPAEWNLIRAYELEKKWKTARSCGILHEGLQNDAKSGR